MRKYPPFFSPRGLRCLAIPNVTPEENFDRGRHRDCEESSEKSSEDERPEEHGENDGHGMEPNRISNDFRCRHKRVDLLHDNKDGEHSCDIPPLGQAEGFRGPVEVSDDTGRDKAEDVSDVWDDAQEGHKDSDE